MNEGTAFNHAIAEIRRVAVTQSHEVRRQMFKIANFWADGFVMDPTETDPSPMLLVSIPVKYEGKTLGDAEMMISKAVEADQLVDVHARFIPNTEDSHNEAN